MKKVLILFVMLTYAASSIGASVHLHYCCGKLDDISFSIEPKTKCAGNAGDHKSCCDSKKVDLKIDSDQVSESKAFIFTHDPVPAPLLELINHNQTGAGTVTTPHLLHSPPPTLPLFIYNCNFRI